MCDIDLDLLRRNFVPKHDHRFLHGKHGLVTYIQVNVYIGNTLSWDELSKLTYVED